MSQEKKIYIKYIYTFQFLVIFEELYIIYKKFTYMQKLKGKHIKL